ncbi:MAG: hypothetical protein H7842_12850 [Gammaproteobacteria bacterium SHHR-1]
MTGGKSPRQRVWERVRAQGKPFELADVRPADMNRATCYSILKGWQAAGIIAEISHPQRKITERLTWELIRDQGLEAPRVNRQGQPVTAGRGNEAMWAQMRHFLSDFDYRELAAHASSRLHPVAGDSAKSYLHALAQAGYLIETRAAVRQTSSPARYRLDPRRNTGPRPPMVQRNKQLYDPNLGRIVWSDPYCLEGDA